MRKKQVINYDTRNRYKDNGRSVEERIQTGWTLYYDTLDEAKRIAKELRTYTYPCFEYFKTTSGNEFRHTGYCVPK